MTRQYFKKQMNKKNSDAEWEKWGEKDPYFGVITIEKFRNRNLSKESKMEFFNSGREHVRNVIEVSRRFLDSGFSPKKVLDFGCGVGRLVMPFCEIVEQVVGLDVSESMLKEALNNCNEYSVQNVRLIKSDDKLSSLKGSYDLIHSFIVFQHIPVERGMHILTNLLSHLEDGGICAIQFIYSSPYSQWLSHATIGKQVKLFKKIKRQVKILMKIVRDLSETRKSLNLSDKDAEIQMNLYNLDEILLLIQSLGTTNLHVEFTDNSGVLGVYLYFQKPRKVI